MADLHAAYEDVNAAARAAEDQLIAHLDKAEGVPSTSSAARSAPRRDRQGVPEGVRRRQREGAC